MKVELAGKKGQSIVEVLVAIGVITISISAVITVAFGNQSAILDAKNRNQALQIAKSNLEENRAIGKSDFISLDSNSETEGIYLKEIIVENLAPHKKSILSRVSWDAQSISKNVEIATIVTDPEEAQNQGGDTGGGGLTGDWQNPQTLGSINLGPGNSATGLDVINKIVYLSASASAAEKVDFFVIDATDGQNPIITASINTGPTLNDVDASAGYAYVANNDIAAQLQVIDVSDINNPQLITSFQLPGVIDPNGVGKTIFYYDSKVFIGTPNLELSPEFYAIDVSNPSSPTLLGSKEIGGDVNSIYVANNTAYISTSLDTEELKILDIENPSSIAEIGSYNGDGTNDGNATYVVDNDLFLGRLLGGDEFKILDIENPGAIEEIGELSVSTDINGIVVRDELAFMGTNDANNELKIWNISDPSNIVLWSSLNFPQIITSLDYEDNRVYAAVRSNDGLRIITSQ